MKTTGVPFHAKFVVSMAFLLGILATALMFFDLHLWHRFLRLHTDPQVTAQIESLRKSILHIHVSSCDGQGESLGTGFVIKGGYVATAAHVIGDQEDCQHRIRLVDFKGLDHPGDLEAISATDDVALLKIADTTLPPLAIADSTAYEKTEHAVQVVTLGYPLAGVITPVEEAGFSGEGNISQFDRSQNRFITSGLNINHGNSGGPIFVRDNWKVLGIAVAKLDAQVGDGIGLAVPAKTLIDFFREKTGLELP